MDSEFDEVMKIFRTNLPYEEVQALVTSHLEKWQIDYIKNVEAEEYKKAYKIAKKVCVILQQNLKCLCLKIQNQLPNIKDIKDMIITLLDDYRQFSDAEISQMFDVKLKLKKNEDVLPFELKRLQEFLEDHLFILISFVNNIGAIEILRKKTQIGLNYICRALSIRSYLMTKNLFIYQQVQLQLNVCFALNQSNQPQQAIQLITVPMQILEALNQDSKTHDFLVKNRITFSLIEYSINNNQKAMIPYPKEIPPFQIHYHLLLGYQFFAKVFELLGKTKSQQECQQYYNRMYDEYKRMNPKAFEQLKQKQELLAQLQQKSSRQSTQQKQEKQKTETIQVEKDEIESERLGEDNSIVFFDSWEDESFNVAMNLREEQDCLEIIIYSVEIGFTKKLYVSLLDLRGDYKDIQTYQNLFNQIQVIDLERGQFDLVNQKWYETISGCMHRIAN
ncbi:unnamed protein product (macronuclear) [Paramecium tetraurelia]|uniref:Uncharacterized protein n=1 Tax=Paramecium tetraurelia TaxID=5888 RepID=A0CFM2_PARTE|nr:uncharacterized protein GSPATT00038029001 [Paramecium tetraurelia]CAK69589.1 unnamed protein product [Paramecium tetraurelia]|eukprot:XP_001436986.1 hypothetical protein (macronuclear) [Paramecium tetraurelia strain d4-2]